MATRLARPPVRTLSGEAGGRATPATVRAGATACPSCGCWGSRHRPPGKDGDLEPGRRRRRRGRPALHVKKLRTIAVFPRVSGVVEKGYNHVKEGGW